MSKKALTKIRAYIMILLKFDMPNALTGTVRPSNFEKESRRSVRGGVKSGRRSPSSSPLKAFVAIGEDGFPRYRKAHCLMRQSGSFLNNLGGTAEQKLSSHWG